MKKFLLIPAALLASSAFAAPKITAQSIIVNPTQPDLSVNVRVDKDPTGNAAPNYKIGENIVISASVNRDAYVYLFNVDATGEVVQILPNKLQGGGNFVKANTTASFPAKGSGFQFNIDGPAGLNKVLALASVTPLNLDQIVNFKTAQDQLATASAKGQDKLAQALSIVVNPLPQNNWVTDTAFFNVVAANPITTGGLFVGTNLPGATVILNGRTLGPANQTYPNLAPGTYPIKVTLAGYQVYSGVVRITANQTFNLPVDFVTRVTTPAPAPVVSTNTASVNIRSSVNGARIFVDGKEVGTIRNGGLNLTLPKGGHEITMIYPGYKTFVASYDVQQGGTITINPSR